MSRAGRLRRRGAPATSQPGAGAQSPPVSAPAAVRALQAALAAEHAAVYGYGVIGAHLAGSVRAQATADWLAHQKDRNTLESMLTARRVQPGAPAVAYQLPVPVQNAAAAVSLAALIEDRITSTYLGLVAVSSPALRAFGAQHVQAAALRAAAWHGSTVAFPGLPATPPGPGRGVANGPGDPPAAGQPGAAVLPCSRSSSVWSRSLLVPQPDLHE